MRDKRNTNRNAICGGLLALGLTSLLASCNEAVYLWQAVKGQSQLIFGARTIEEVKADPKIPNSTKKRLELVEQVRDFAINDLGLPDHGSYRQFVDLGRPYVVWNVFSAPEFSIDLHTSCFPIAGCVSYRGFFVKEDAQHYADQRKSLGEDVQMGGVSAYSTLGYLKDPVLSSMFNYSEASIVRTIIHEMAHGAFYIAGDTVFNESYAMTVEEEGIKRWLAKTGDSQLAEQDKLEKLRSDDFNKMLLKTRAELALLYQQPLSNNQMRQRKKQIFADLQAAYQKIKTERWAGYSGYDAWFARSMNNAALGAVAAYADLVPDFQLLLKRKQGNIPAFVKAAKRCSQQTKSQRRQCLRK